jgi:hypothetical protein
LVSRIGLRLMLPMLPMVADEVRADQREMRAKQKRGV